MHTNMPKFQLAHLGSAAHQFTHADESPTKLTFISFAVRTSFVPLQFQQALDSLSVLCSALCGWIRGGSARHDHQ